MFRGIVSKIQRDKDYPARQFTLDVYGRVLDGALYDHLSEAFHTEKNEAGEYVPLRNRRPSVKHNICRLVVDDSVSLLFSDGHFPTPDCEDEGVKTSLASLVKDSALNEVMLEAATTGSVGSVAIHMRVLKQADDSYRVFYAPHATGYLTPTFSLTAPDALVRVSEQYKVKGAVLKAQGYDVPADQANADFWFAREWDDSDETWFLPWLVKDDPPGRPERVKDTARSVSHGLGFVPWVWIKNLPGKLRLLPGPSGAVEYSQCDGGCTFAAAVDIMVEIDYQLSQAGRGLKYSMDPTLLIKEPAAPQNEIVKSPANALVVSEKGDAKLLEIGGSAFTVVLEYVRALREFGLENMHGNRADPQKLSAAQSGRAMELMNQALIWLSDKLRVSYGEGALLALLRMTLEAHKKFPLTVAGAAWDKLSDDPISLTWPRWHAPTSHDLQEQATTLTALKDGGILSRETAVQSLAGNYDIEDVQAEIVKLDADIAAASAVIEAQGGQPKPAEAAPV